MRELGRRVADTQSQRGFGRETSIARSDEQNLSALGQRKRAALINTVLGGDLHAGSCLILDSISLEFIY